MKRIKINKIALIAVLGFPIIFFISCLKDKGPVQDFSQSPPVISFQGNGLGTNFSAISVLPSTTQSNPMVDSIGVSLGVSSLYLSKPVVVNVSPDQATLDAYNAANSTSYTLLPSTAYTLANTGTWTIPAGKNLAYFKVSLIGTNIDFSKSNALALKIMNAPGTTIASNLNTYVLIINLKSPFEDLYDISGTRTRYNGTTVGSGFRDSFAISGTVQANTVNDSTIDVQAADAGLGANMSLKINSDNSVTVLPSILNPANTFNFSNDGSPSSYNPATKTFTLHYKYTTPNLRHIDEQMVGH